MSNSPLRPFYNDLTSLAINGSSFACTLVGSLRCHAVIKTVSKHTVFITTAPQCEGHSSQLLSRALYGVTLGYKPNTLYNHCALQRLEDHYLFSYPLEVIRDIATSSGSGASAPRRKTMRKWTMTMTR